MKKADRIELRRERRRANEQGRRENQTSHGYSAGPTVVLYREPEVIHARTIPRPRRVSLLGAVLSAVFGRW